MSSDFSTPRTDEEAGWVLDSTPVHAQSFAKDPDGSYVTAEFARELERENIQLFNALEGVLHSGTSNAYAYGQDLLERAAKRFNKT